MATTMRDSEHSLLPARQYSGQSCVMRTQTLADPTSWRAWDGTAFELQMTDPYTGAAAVALYLIPVWSSLTRV